MATKSKKTRCQPVMTGDMLPEYGCPVQPSTTHEMRLALCAKFANGVDQVVSS